jgi:nicotinate (nicotinamide) nucleotide adenylyltransferase
VAGLKRVGLGILGGAFDPPHVGHVALARAAQEHFGCERLLALVVADPGHKSTFAPAQARLELARLAFADVPGAGVELDTHARTVDFLEERRPADAVFILGGDELAAFPNWKSPERVLELVSLGVAQRPGVPEAELRETRARPHLLLRAGAGRGFVDGGSQARRTRRADRRSRLRRRRGRDRPSRPLSTSRVD